MDEAFEQLCAKMHRAGHDAKELVVNKAGVSQIVKTIACEYCRQWASGLSLVIWGTKKKKKKKKKIGRSTCADLLMD
jgi:hypothetical protein